MRSIIDRVSHLYFIMSTEFCPSLYAKKAHQTVAQGGWENDYNTVEGEAVSRLNLKWKAFHIRFLRKIPFHTYTNKSVPCSIMSTVCVYLLRWLMRSASVTFFPQHFVHIGSRWVEISWYAIEVNVTVNASIGANVWSGLLPPILGMLIFFSSSAEILISVYFKLSSLPHYMCGSDR